KTRCLERRAQGAWREIEEMLARLVVVPETSEETRLQAAHVRCDHMNDASGDEETAHRGKRRDRIGEVLHGVVQRDDGDARLRQVELLEPPGGDAQPALASALCRERGDP